MTRLAVVSVDDVVRRCRLRWFGHVKRIKTDDWVSACTERECVSDAMKKLKRESAQHRDLWSMVINGNHLVRKRGTNRS